MSDPAPSEEPSAANGGRSVDGRFAPGHKKLGGNVVGSRHRATKVVDAIMFHNIKPIITLLTQKALAGEPWAVQLVAKSTLPKRLDLIDEPMPTPAPSTAAEAAKALSEIYARVASGALDIEAAQALTLPLQALIAAHNVAVLERQVAEARETIERLMAEIQQMKIAQTGRSP
jgi:hypothetical protein